MRIIFTKFDKKSINSLPRILFPGKIVLIDKAEDTEEAVNFLLSQPILGVDTGETCRSDCLHVPSIR